jgi:hypothetical protein
VNGSRPGLPTSAKWTYEGFAEALADEVEDDGACSPRAVSNWCKGRFVPREIEPILNVLFDVEAQGPQRAGLRRAYNLAVEESLREAKLSPALGVWVPKGPRLVFDHTVQPGDAKAARDPIQAGLQAQVAEMARALGRESDRPSNTRLLPKLSVLAFALGGLLACNPPAMTGGRLADAYALVARLGGILETDDAIRPDDSDAPLDTVTRGELRDLIALGATWLRGYPSIMALDNRAVTPWTSAGMDDAARRLLRCFRDDDCLTDEDFTHALLALDSVSDLPSGPAKPGNRAWKAATLAVGTVNNLIVTAARHVAAARAGVASADADAGERAVRLTRVLVVSAPQVRALGGLMATDLRHGLNALLEQASRKVDAGAAVDGAESDVPVPDDVEAAAVELILRGEALPASWRPFIRKLVFPKGDFADLTPIAGMTALKNLHLVGTQVSDLTPIAGMTALHSLFLSRTQVRNLTPIAGMTALQTLYLNGTRVSDLTPIAGMTTLQNLRLDGTRVSDLTPTAGMIALQRLDLDRTQVSDLTPIARMTALQTLRLDGTQVSDLTPIAGMTALLTLYLNGTQVSDLTPIAGMTALQTLDLNETRVSDLTPIAGMIALQRLYLRGTQVSDLTPIAGMTALQSLYLAGTRVSDLTPIAGMTALRLLHLLGSRVTDLSPLDALSDLEIVGAPVARRRQVRRARKPT